MGQVLKFRPPPDRLLRQLQKSVDMLNEKQTAPSVRDQKIKRDTVTPLFGRHRRRRRI